MSSPVGAPLAKGTAAASPADAAAGGRVIDVHGLALGRERGDSGGKEAGGGAGGGAGQGRVSGGGRVSPSSLDAAPRPPLSLLAGGADSASAGSLTAATSPRATEGAAAAAAAEGAGSWPASREAAAAAAAAAEAAAEAAPHPVKRRKVGLVLVDLQNDFCEGGALAVPDGDAVIPIANLLRARFAWEGGIYLTQDWHPADHASFASNNEGAALFSMVELEGIGPQIMWPNHCVQNSRGAQFHPELVRDEQRDVVVQKGTHRATDSYSGFGDASATKCFEQTHLQAALNAAGATDVVVLGLATDFCVSFTCKDAAACGFRTWCVLDGSRHIAADSLAAEIAAMRAAGCHIVTSADVAEIVAAPTSEAAVELAQRFDARDAAAVSK